jgi:hypothetical protein
VEVRFVPFSELVDNSEGFDPDSFRLPSFEEEMQAARHKEEETTSAEAEIASSEPHPAVHWSVGTLRGVLMTDGSERIKNPAAVALGRLGGSKGGQGRAQ